MPGIGAVRAYDANSQFLGVLVDDLSGLIRIFVPSLSRTIFLNLEDGDVPQGPLYFDQTGCSGNAYTHPVYRYHIIKIKDEYFTGDGATPQKISFKSILAGECWTSLGNDFLLPTKPVILPITLPVALPLNFLSQ